MVLCASEREGLWASGTGPRKVPGEGSGEVRVWPCVCGALEEWDRPARGAGSWAGKGAQKEFDSERWKGSPGLRSPTLHGRPTMGVGLLGGVGRLAHSERVGGSEMGVRLCLPPPCPWMRRTQCSGSLPSDSGPGTAPISCLLEP